MEGLSRLEGQLEMVGLKLMVEGIRAGTHSEGRRERILDYRSCNAETVGTK